MNRTGPLVLVVIVTLLALWAADWSTGAHGATRRYFDPIVLTGAQLGALGGATGETLSVWIRHHGQWQREASQMDERDAAGNYTAMEDKLLDANDELVWVVGDGGDKAPDDAWPDGMGRDHPRVEVKVTDPIDAEFTSWHYVFWSGQTPGEAPEPVVTWDPASREVKTAEYTIGLADQDTDHFVGIKRLSLYEDGTNLVDRLKIRGSLALLGFETPVNEETLGDALAIAGVSLSFDPVIFGPLRVVLSAGGGFAYANRFALFGGLGALGNAGGGVTGIDFKNARLSLDFSPAAAPATYTDPNFPAGAPVDGVPDAVPEVPVPPWREIAFASGRLVVLSAAVAADSKARVYYHDDGTTDATDTGDKRSFGDNGVTAPDLKSLIDTGFPGDAVVLPIGRSVTAAQLAENRASPLAITITGGAAVPTATVATPARPTASPTATRTPAITPTRGPGPGINHDIFLPRLSRALQR